MKVLMVIQGNDAVASRYRALSYIPFLKKAGWEVEVLPYLSGLLDRLRLIRKSKTFDLVFIQKNRLPGWQLRAIRRGGARIIYDVDDAVMFKSSRHGEKQSTARRKKFDTAVMNADLVIAGNPYLASIIRKQHARVEIQPLPFVVDSYLKKEDYTSKDNLVLGWIGGGKSLVFLRSLSPVFNRIGERFPHVQLKIVCNEFFDLESMKVIKKQWAEEDEGKDVASFDIGLAPLPDDVWSRGKCGTKLLQCFCAGVPVVASPVGVHEEMIQPGESGFLAATHEEWEESIVKLITSASLREKFGKAGLSYVQEKHELSFLAGKLDQIFRSVL